VSALRERDFRAALDFVGEVHDAQDREEFRSIVLPGYRRLVPALHVSYNEIEGDGQVTAAIVEPELPDWAVPVWERYAGENPLLQRYLRTRDGRALRFSDVVSRSQLHGLPLYRHFYAPLGVEHQIAFILPSTPLLTIGVALTRADADFGERDRELLELTRPHMIQAYRAAELRERLAATVAGLSSALEADGTAIVVLEANGSVGFVSAAAASLLDGRTPLLAEGRPLPPALAAWVASGQPDGRVELGEESLLMRRFRNGAQTLILLESARLALSRKVLRELGLTRREAAVLHEVALGAGTGEVASTLEIAPRTVAKHLQRIHAKLGVATRAQAVATAWAAAGSPPRTRPRTP